jgi:HAD superfamily hydrolase (TIGR01457 family)
MTRPLPDIRCFLLDMDGTFYLGDRLLRGALRFVEVVQEQGRDYLFLTNNSSKHRRQYAEKISRLGLPVPESRIFTSGEATALHLQATRPRCRTFLVGTEALAEDLLAYGLYVDDDAPDVVVLGFDTGLTYARLWRLCDLVRAGLPYIATHADFNCPTEAGFMPDVGAMIAFVKASTGREPDLVVGKPNRLIVDTASRKLGIPVQALAMVGDRLYTDIALGRTAGIPTVLVLSGETRREDLADSPHQPTYIFEDLGAFATFLAQEG